MKCDVNDMTLLPRSKIVVHMLHINETNAPEPTQREKESEMGRGNESGRKKSARDERKTNGENS